MLIERDIELLERWRGGDMRAGSDLLKRHFETLHRFFSSKVAGQAEDLVQQTFIACVESKDDFRGEASFRAYLFGLARLTLYTHFRKDRRLRAIDFTTTSVASMQQSPTGALARRDDERLLLLALQQVPVDQQIILELTYWEELSAPEVALALAIPENTVYSRLRRAKAHLRKTLEQLSQHPAERERALSMLLGGTDPTDPDDFDRSRSAL